MSRLNRIRRWVTWTGLVLLVIGAKLWLIDYAGSSVPRWDQLDGEGEYVLRPWVEDTLKPLDLWRPHNEHRIVFTKLQALGLVALNGQWDAYVQMFTNAVLHALFLPVLLSWIRQRIKGPPFIAIALIATAAWVLPLTWENTLQGFQSAFYVLIWLCFLQLRGVLGSDRFGWRWWGGQSCGLLALGALGSGMLSSIAVLAVIVLDAARKRQVSRFALVTAAVSLVWISLGWWSRTPFPGHDVLRAQTLGEILDGVAQIFAWPMQAWLPVAMIAGAPLVILVGVWTWKTDRDGFERTTLGLAAWFTLIAIATAWLRYHGAILSSRYLDQFVFGLILQGMALALLPMRQSVRWGLLAAWLIAIGVSFQHDMSHTTSRTLPEFRQRIAVQEANTRLLLATQDPSVLEGKGMFDLPHPSAEWLWHCWQHASIQKLLPAAVRPPVPFTALPDEQTANLPDSPYPIIAASPTTAQNEPWIWRSERQSADTLPILRFRINGELGDPQAALSMRIVSDAWGVDVEPDGPAPHRWKTINVIRPPGEWWIELGDRDSIASIALTAPVELGWLSWGTEKAIKYHLWFLSIGLAMMLGGLLAEVPARVLLKPSA